MEKSQKLKRKFDELKTAVSDHYPGERYKRLRCCLYGTTHGAELNKTGVGCHLFNALEIQGVISPTNIKLLEEITELTDVKGAIDCVNKYKWDNNVEDSEGKILTPYRRGLVKALMHAGDDELENVVANYIELNPYKFANLWDAVFKLEKARLLEDNPEKIQRFANLLEDDTKALFLGKTDVSIMQGTTSRLSASSTFFTTQRGTSSGPSASSTSSANQHNTSSSSSVSSTNQPSTSSRLLVFPVTQQDEKIRKYLLERQRIMCYNYKQFTPPVMQNRFDVNIEHMFTDLDLLKEMKDGKQDAKPINLAELLAIIKEKPACKVLIEGEGGIGKTTLLRYLAYNWSTDKSDKQPFKAKILFLLNIRDIGEGEDALDVIVKHIKLKDFRRKTRLPEDPDLIEQFILNHDDEIVLMLDGLDELKTGSESPISLFEKQDFQRSVVILTSRSENINEFIKNSDVHVKVKGFSEEKVEEYIKKYFESESQLGDSLVKEIFISNHPYFLVNQLPSGYHPELLSMCRNPMLLLLICIMWEERQEIPSHKADLFREIFRSIINQYNRDDSKPKINRFEDIPKPYASAMCLLGHCMYHGLMKNQLSIYKRDLVGHDDLITFALKLGFVYKDESFLKTNFEEIYAAPHKLILESLVGFYLYKLCEETVDMPIDLSLDDKEWEKIRESQYLKNATNFAIGFLGANADKFLKNCVTNSLSTCRSLVTYYLPMVKQDHDGAVMKALTDYFDNLNLEIKQHIPDVCKSLRLLLIDHIKPNTGVDKDKRILHLIREVYNSEKLVEINEVINTMSPTKIAKFLVHILLAVKDQKPILENICINKLKEEEVKYFIDECKKLDIQFDLKSFILKTNMHPSYLVYLLTHSRNLETLRFSSSINGDVGIFLNATMKILCNFEGFVLNLQSLRMRSTNLSNINGTSLASLMDISPKLRLIQMSNCNLTGDVINDMMTECFSKGIKLSELHHLYISNNNFSNINSTSLASLMDISPMLKTLEMQNCNLRGDVINDMTKVCSSRGIKFITNL